MQLEHTESAQRQRIALYKNNSSVRMCAKWGILLCNALTLIELLSLPFGVASVILIIILLLCLICVFPWFLWKGGCGVINMHKDLGMCWACTQLWHDRHWWVCASVDSEELKKSSDCARHFLNQCDIYEVAKMVHSNRSDDHCNWSNTYTYAHTHTHVHTQCMRARAHTHTHTQNACTLSFSVSLYVMFFVSRTSHTK